MRALAVASLFAVGSGWACGPAELRETEDTPNQAKQQTGAPIWFEEVAREVGVDFVHVRGLEIRYHFPEVVGSGIALFDHDGDGLVFPDMGPTTWTSGVCSGASV